MYLPSLGQQRRFTCPCSLAHMLLRGQNGGDIAPYVIPQASGLEPIFGKSCAHMLRRVPG